jgi:hypothetical protein
MKRVLYSCLGVIVCPFLTSCGDNKQTTGAVAPGQMQSASSLVAGGDILSPPHQYPNGMTVAAIRTNKLPEFEEMLHTKVWRFDVTVPKGLPLPECRIGLDMDQKPHGSWWVEPGPDAAGIGQHFQVSIIVVPMGNDWRDSARAKYIMRIRGVDRKPGNDGMTTTWVQENLFRNFDLMTDAPHGYGTDDRWVLQQCWMMKKNRRSISTTNPPDRVLYVMFKPGTIKPDPNYLPASRSGSK